ncbi:MAG TPA: response regulator [Thermoanaerobaculia bacterium]|nr:response regulator [Thermoanaerobaculia bacterium]
MPVGNILVVEDDEVIRRALVEVLGEHFPVQVEGARDGCDALHHILTRRYGVVVLDMMMPKMSGGDLLDSLKAMLSDPSLDFQGEPPAIIVVTAVPPDTLPNRAIEQRFPGVIRAVLRKPVDYEALVSSVRCELSG